MSLTEAQGGYSDDPAFEELADRLSQEVFDITATNGRLWTLMGRSNLDAAVDAAADNRTKIRGVKPDIERLSRWEDPAPSQRFTQHKLTREFGTALKEFQNIQKTLAHKEREVINEPAHPDPSPEDSHPPALIELESNPHLLQQQAFEDQLREDEVAYQRGLIEDREEEIQGIEQGITELNDIFTSLSAVIQEQGQSLDNIESNIYSVRQDTQNGARELTKAAKWQRASAARKLCLLTILLVVGSFIVISILI